MTTQAKKSIFITGAASGIGKASAALFAQQGWFVGLFDIDLQHLEVVKHSIGTKNSCTHQIDVTQPDSVKEALAIFGKHTGQTMNVLLNNAGVLHMGLFETISLEKHKQILDVNVFGIINCTQQALPLLKNTPKAQIINLSSASAMYGIPEFASYSASKHAVRALTEALSLELERYNIRVNDIMPSFVNTPMVNEASYKAASLVKANNLLSPEKIAETIWKATQSNKVHWKLPFGLAVAEKVLNTVGAMRWFVKKSTLS